MGKIIRYCKLTEDHIGDNSFDVSRAGVLRNPYTYIKNRDTKAMVKVKTREEAIELYKEYFKLMMESKEPGARPFQREFKKIVDAYKKYDVVYIGCYCHLNESCHGDYIIEQAIRTAVRDCILEKARKESTSNAS